MMERKKLITALVSIVGMTGFCQTVYAQFVPAPTTGSRMTLTTSKAAGEAISLAIGADVSDKNSIWIDLDNDGRYQAGEEISGLETPSDYRLKSQTFTIYGKVTGLDCFNGKITALDPTNNPDLMLLECSYNSISILDLTGNPKLEELACYESAVKTIDLTKNPALRLLECGANELAALDITRNTALRMLECAQNQLTTLDVTKHTALTRLICGDNKISELDLSRNVNLTQLRCYRNSLTSINVSESTRLDDLDCSGNELAALDVSKNPLLERLICNGNRLKMLDVTKNGRLDELYCGDNGLTALDLSGNPELERLVCGANKLTSLDLSRNTALAWLICSDNLLKTLDVAKNTKLTRLVCYSNQIVGAEMDKLLNGLPTLKDTDPGIPYYAQFVVVNLKNTNEINACSPEQVKIAETKNWKVLDLNGDGDDMIRYEGVAGAGLSDAVSDACRVFPNPVVAFVNIELPAEAAGRVAYLQDMQAKTILRIVLTSVNERIDLRQVPAGTYFLRIGMQVAKIVKL